VRESDLKSLLRDRLKQKSGTAAAGRPNTGTAASLLQPSSMSNMLAQYVTKRSTATSSSSSPPVIISSAAAGRPTTTASSTSTALTPVDEDDDEEEDDKDAPGGDGNDSDGAVGDGGDGSDDESYSDVLDDNGVVDFGDDNGGDSNETEAEEVEGGGGNQDDGNNNDDDDDVYQCSDDGDDDRDDDDDNVVDANGGRAPIIVGTAFGTTSNTTSNAIAPITAPANGDDSVQGGSRSGGGAALLKDLIYGTNTSTNTNTNSNSNICSKAAGAPLPAVTAHPFNNNSLLPYGGSNTLAASSDHDHNISAGAASASRSINSGSMMHTGTDTGSRYSGLSSGLTSGLSSADVAIVPGLCEDMCPAEERQRRIDEVDVHKLEYPFPPPPAVPHFVPTAHSMAGTMIKKFQRSSADHELRIPHLLRTPRALYRSVCYMEDHIMERHLLLTPQQQLEQGVPEREKITNLIVYLFVWDRFRMIAKDFTLQVNFKKNFYCDYWCLLLNVIALLNALHGVVCKGNNSDVVFSFINSLFLFLISLYFSLLPVLPLLTMHHLLDIRAGEGCSVGGESRADGQVVRDDGPPHEERRR
jgi:hypothetical protein